MHSSVDRDLLRLTSNHEEADIDAHMCGIERLIVVCRDTDVLIVLLQVAAQLPKEVWFMCGISSQPKFIAVHRIDLADSVRSNIATFHAVTGCDSVSQFYGIGKTMAWKVFNEFPYLLQRLGCCDLTADALQEVEEVVCRLYLTRSSAVNVNDVRYLLYQKGTKYPENLPPTAALHQHIRRAHYQAEILQHTTT